MARSGKPSRQASDVRQIRNLRRKQWRHSDQVVNNQGWKAPHRHKKSPTGLRLVAKSWELRKDILRPPLFSPSDYRNNERGACQAPAPDCFGTPPDEGERDYFLPALAGAAFGLAAGVAFFTGAEDFAAAAFFAGAAFAAGFLAGAAFAAGFLAGAAFFTAGLAAAFAAGFLAGAAFAAGFAAALAGAAFFTAGFAAAFAAGFLAGAAFALATAAFGLAAGAAFFTAAATFAVAAFAGAFFAGALDAGALDDCLAMRCPFRCADGRNDPARSCISDSRLASQRSNRLIFAA